MRANAQPSEGIQLWSPTTMPSDGPLGIAVADCLAAAFGSGVWARTPMPVGGRSDPHSARGIVAELGAGAQALVASVDDDRPREQADVLGCVVGNVLDEDLIEAYGLNVFGARPGDGLLAYIGIQPQAQGLRVLPHADDRLDVAPESDRRWMKRQGVSLAGLLFRRWLELSTIERCPRVFVRTRSVLPQIQHLATKNGFAYQGRFDLDFHGERQDRLVYKRVNARPAMQPQPLPLVA